MILTPALDKRIPGILSDGEYNEDSSKQHLSSSRKLETSQKKRQCESEKCVERRPIFHT
jgi:hypothetical protein